MRIFNLIAVLIAASTLPLVAQTTTTVTPSNSIVNLTVTSAPIPVNITAALSSSTVQAGGTATINVKVSGNVGTPTGSIQLDAKGPNDTTYTTLNTFALVNGNATCTYPVLPTAVPGVYSLKAIYVPPPGGAYY